MPVFVWDESKARSNKNKHGISFELASRIWDDPQHLIMPDAVYDGEERWLAIGLVGHILIMVAVYSEHPADIIRLISARKATPHERRRYDQQTTD